MSGHPSIQDITCARMLPLLLCGHHDCFGLSVQVKRLLQVQCVDYTSVELDQVGESRDPVQLATPTSKINALHFLASSLQANWANWADEV